MMFEEKNGPVILSVAKDQVTKRAFLSSAAIFALQPDPSLPAQDDDLAGCSP